MSNIFFSSYDNLSSSGMYPEDNIILVPRLTIENLWNSTYVLYTTIMETWEELRLGNFNNKTVYPFGMSGYASPFVEHLSSL